MPDLKPLRAIGLMSGTSLDGIDAALITTDGEKIEATGQALTLPYEHELRERLRHVLGRDKDDAETQEIARDLGLAHAVAVNELLSRASRAAKDIDVVGFHGHTILHRPETRLTRQIGDAQLLADRTGIPVVADFRSADVAAGGEGAPLAPLFHAALAKPLRKPLAVLNLGGVGNVTWIGADGTILAFDTGPGNALIDDWMRHHTKRAYDEDGKFAARGTADADAVAALLSHPYFDRKPPKSLDRDAFGEEALDDIAPEDGAATLTAFTAAAVAKARTFFPKPVERWLVCGGGRHNATLMDILREALDAPVDPVEAVGWNGDALEAQAFGFLAVRSLYGLPLSLPTTTGVPKPLTGGRLFLPKGRKKPV
jgi:anhydro-N-acetylmuramic acid kinase